MEAIKSYVLPAEMPALVERYHAPLVRYAARMLSYDQAEDIVQQCWVRVWMALQAGTEVQRALVSHWLYRIVTNLVKDTLRHQRVIAWQSLEMLTAPPTCESPEQQVEDRDRAARALAPLPAEQRQALLLKTAGYDFGEIGAVLGSSTLGARQRYWRARWRLAAWNEGQKAAG